MISVIIPARNEEKNLERLLDSVEANDFEDYEVIVVDGDSDDSTREVAKEHGAKVIEGPGEGLAKAQNIGWRNAQGDIIWFIDADCKLEPDSLRKAAEFFEENPGKDIGGLDVVHTPVTSVEKAVSAENLANKGRGKVFQFTKIVIDRLKGVLS